MRQTQIMITLMLMPEIAAAHVGHLGELAGHDHIIAGAALGAILVIAGARALIDRTADDPSSEGEEDPDAAEELQEA